MLRKRLVATLAAIAALLSGLTVSAPANAAAGQGVATLASVTPNQWSVGASQAATASWTNSVDTLTSVLVRSPWPWGAAWTTDTTGSVTSSGAVAGPGAQVITCTQGSFSFVFRISSATTTGDPDCKFSNTSSWKGVWIEGGGLSVANNATLSVDFPLGAVIAPNNARTDSWLVGGYYAGYDSNYQAAPETTAIAVNAAGIPLPVITIKIDGNGGNCSSGDVSGYIETWATAPETCSKAGEIFTGFNTSADGSGVAVAPGGPLHLTSDNTLYAIYVIPRAPSAPSNVVAVPGQNSIKVSWQTPADEGTGSISNYLVEANPSRKVCITSTASADPLSCTFNLPATNTQYTFTAQALNGAGWGATSAASNAVSPFNVILDAATRTQDKVLLIFKGGSTVSVSGRGPGLAPGTVITPQVKTGSGDWVSETQGLPKVGADRSISWSKKLAKSLNGSEVDVRLTLGDVASDPASLKIGSRFGVPDAPRNLKLETERNGVRVSWDAPTNDGGSPVTSYLAKANNDGLTPSCQVVAGKPLTCRVPITTARVKADTTIPFTVTAINARGEGPAAKGSLRAPLRWIDITSIIIGQRGAPGGGTLLLLDVQSNGFKVGDKFTVELKNGADGTWEKQKGQLLITETTGSRGVGEWSGSVPKDTFSQGFTVRVANPQAAPATWTAKPRP